ncbi:MAG: hypothetical protein ACOY3K_02905 [Candidatus Omnitrophota bacterium]
MRIKAVWMILVLAGTVLFLSPAVFAEEATEEPVAALSAADETPPAEPAEPAPVPSMPGMGPIPSMLPPDMPGLPPQRGMRDAWKAKKARDGKGPHEDMAGDMCPMCHMKMKWMMTTEMVPAGDGGVILLQGGKLQKYGPDLTLINEVDLAGKEQLAAMIEKMKTDCPMCQWRMKKMGGPAAPEAPGAAQPAAEKILPAAPLAPEEPAENF